MSKLYRKPEVKSLSSKDVSDCMGPAQAAYSAQFRIQAVPLDISKLDQPAAIVQIAEAKVDSGIVDITRIG